MKKSVIAVVTTVVLIALVAAFALFGCAKKEPEVIYDTNEPSIYIQKDGTVTETDRSAFDQDYYDIEEFKEYVDNNVKEYNDSIGTDATDSDSEAKADPVSVVSISMEDDQVVMKLVYQSINHYVAFNEKYQNLADTAVFEVCEVGNQTSHLADDKTVNFLSAEDLTTVSTQTALEVQSGSKKTYFIGVNFAANIYVEGKVMYMTDNVTLNQDGVAMIGDEDVTDSEGQSRLAYIVYR